MNKISKISGKAIPLDWDDVDTDLIIPAQCLTSVSRKGYGENLFRRLRDNDPEFVFDQEKFKGANILITKENFGCGSSREHAVWALLEAGIQAIIAISFGDIFSNNAEKNGLVLIQQPANIIDKFIALATSGNYQITIDIENQKINTQEESFNFDIDPFYKYCFINGLDELDYLLSHSEEIKKYKNPYNWAKENVK